MNMTYVFSNNAHGSTLPEVITAVQSGERQDRVDGWSRLTPTLKTSYPDTNVIKREKLIFL